MKSLVPTIVVLLASIGLMVCGNGCSREGSLAGLVPVHGVVTHNGLPISQGTIGFVPADGTANRPATATISNGNFTMMTTASSPGVMPGKYRVLVISQNGVAAKNKPQTPPKSTPPASTDATLESPLPSTESSTAMEVVSLIPRKYSNPMESGIEVDVAAGMPRLSFNLE